MNEGPGPGRERADGGRRTGTVERAQGRARARGRGVGRRAEPPVQEADDRERRHAEAGEGGRDGGADVHGSRPSPPPTSAVGDVDVAADLLHHLAG